MVDLGNQYDGFECSRTPDGIERGKFCNYIYTREMYKNVQAQVGIDRLGNRTNWLNDKKEYHSL
jgi:hypothetical protein